MRTHRCYESEYQEDKTEPYFKLCERRIVVLELQQTRKCIKHLGTCLHETCNNSDAIIHTEITVVFMGGRQEANFPYKNTHLHKLYI